MYIISSWRVAQENHHEKKLSKIAPHFYEVCWQATDSETVTTCIEFRSNCLCDGIDQGRKGYPKKTCATKTLPNFRVNFLVGFASKPNVYWVVPSNCSEIYLVLFLRLFGFGVVFWLLRQIGL